MKKDGNVYYTGIVASGYRMKDNWNDDEFIEMANQLILEDCSNKYEKGFCDRNYSNVQDYADALGAVYRSNQERQRLGRNNPRYNGNYRHNTIQGNNRYNANNLERHNNDRYNNGIRYNDVARGLLHDGKRRSKRRSKRKSSKRRSSKRRSKRKSSNQ